jgi:ATP-dependent helicase/nuclease subunit B
LRPTVEAVEHLLGPETNLGTLAAGLRELGTALCGDTLWSGPAGRAAADLLTAIEQSPATHRLPIGADDAVPLLRSLLDEVAIRPPYGQHPRISILGLLEARLVKTDLMILSGLSEGTWPAPPSPDPWLPVTVRRRLGLPGPEMRIGLSAHDFASLLCAREVLLTRARRDGRSPTVSSRLLLRLEALTGGLPRARELETLAAALDEPAGRPEPAERPRPAPPVADRPRKIAVTALDRLKADPFAFYAQAMLRLRSLDPLEADQDARWKGDLVHALLQCWLEEDRCAPAALLPRARALLAADDIHPMMRALWSPRLLDAIATLAEKERSQQAAGRLPIAAEVKGEADVANVRLHGRADRIDRLPDGRLAILDYKTGHPPSARQVEAGFALQLGLLGLIAEAGGFPGVSGNTGAHEYWSLAKKQGRDHFGYVEAMDDDDPDRFRATAQAVFSDAVDRWLLGSEPFVAKLHPAFAPYGDYDQLMRLEEWIGRR